MTTYMSLSVNLETLGKGKLMSKSNDREKLYFMTIPVEWNPYICMWKKFGSEIHLIVEFDSGEGKRRILFMYKLGQEHFGITVDPAELEHSCIVILRDGTVCVDKYLSFGYFGGEEFYISLK